MKYLKKLTLSILSFALLTPAAYCSENTNSLPNKQIEKIVAVKKSVPLNRILKDMSKVVTNSCKTLKKSIKENPKVSLAIFGGTVLSAAGTYFVVKYLKTCNNKKTLNKILQKDVATETIA